MMRDSQATWARWWLFCALVLCFVVLQVGRGYAADSVAYRLGSGDKVRVTVFGEKDLSGDFEVNDQGIVALPLIGPVQVAGKTINEVEAVITQKYGKNYLVNPRVNVEVLNYRPFYILGEVQKPGSYPYVGGMTVLNAIALAGGYTPRADRDDIKIKRAATPSAGEQPVTENSVVLPGDVVSVPERFF
jgi:polysaccharide biosynthesis/export protein VpsN